MTLDDLKSEKHALENNISALLTLFTQNTGLNVESIEMKYIQSNASANYVNYTMSVKIDI